MQQAKNSSINSFSGGMNLDIDDSLIKSNQYRYAKNIRSISMDGSKTGSMVGIEGSSIISSTVIPRGATVCATTTVRDYGIAFISKEFGDNKARTGTASGNKYGAEKSTGAYNFSNNISTTYIYGDSLDEAFRPKSDIDICSITQVENRTLFYLGIDTLFVEMDTLSQSERIDVVFSYKNQFGESLTHSGIYGPSGICNIVYDSQISGYWIDANFTTEGWEKKWSISFTRGEHIEYIQGTVYGIFPDGESTTSCIVNVSYIAAESVTPATLGVLELKDMMLFPGYNGVVTYEVVDRNHLRIDKPYDTTTFDRNYVVNSFVVGDNGKCDINVSNGTSDYDSISNITDGSILKLVSTDNEYNVYAVVTKKSDGLYSTNINFIDEVITNPVKLNNILYILFNKDGSIASSGLVFKNYIYLGIDNESNLSITSRYEDSDNIKVYWADGVNTIRSVNIKGNYDGMTDPGMIDTIPRFGVNPPSILGVSTGSIKAGLIQYCYQLISESGSDTSISLMSPIVSLSSYPESSYTKYKGNLLENSASVSSGKSVSVKIDIDNPKSYKKLRLISVSYDNYNAEPTITVVSEVSLPADNASITIHDYGTSAINELTVSELNAIGSMIIKPKYIETKNNILFASNIIDESMVVDYDTRSYQFRNESGVYVTRLHSDSGTSADYTYDKLNTIPIDANCIHSEIYTVYRYADLLYTKNKDGKYGGSGVNVDYVFANTYLVESHSDPRNITRNRGVSKTTGADAYIDARYSRIGDVNRSISSLTIAKSDGTGGLVSLDNFGIPSHVGRLDYSNKYLSNNLTSYMRDEIYRFAAVFYDDKGRRSPAKWIADIRFPANYIHDELWDSSSFEMPEEAKNTDSYSSNKYIGSFLENQELLVKPLGLSFTFRNLNLIPNIKRIEIVRAKRDISNKTIFAQGAMGKTGTKHPEYWKGETEKLHMGTNGSIMPHPMLSMGYQYSFAPISRQDGNPIQHPYGHSVPFADGGNISFRYNGYNTLNPVGLNEDLIESTWDQTEFSPSHSSQGIFTIMSPEVSYFGSDFVEKIKPVSRSIKVDISDVIMPVTTPPTYGGASYIGRAEHDRLMFNYDGKYVNTSLYCMADLHVNNMTSSYDKSAVFYSIGLAGPHPATLTGKRTSSYDMSNNTRTYVNSIGLINLPSRMNTTGGSNQFDIFNSTHPASVGVTRNQTYISYGGVTNTYETLDCNSDSGYNMTAGYTDFIGNGDDDGQKEIPVFSQHVSNYKQNAAVYKYFVKFRKKTISGSNIGTITTVTQNSSSYIDITESTDVDLVSNSKTTFKPIEISDIEYSGVIPSSRSINTSTTDYVSIGGNSYINYNGALAGRYLEPPYAEDGKEYLSITTFAKRSMATGQHGPALIVRVSTPSTIPHIYNLEYLRGRDIDTTNNAPQLLLDNYVSSATATYLVNLKSMSTGIYGGPTYQDRSFTDYISTGSSFENNGTSNSCYTFGGDTFIGIHDYTINRFSDPYVNADDDMNDTYYPDFQRTSVPATIMWQRKYIGALVPVETSINEKLQSGESYVASGNNHLVSDKVGTYGPGISVNYPYSASQEFNEYVYNSTYSSERTSIGYSDKLIDSEDIKRFDCRIYYSETKINDEKSDSWSVFKAANYLDVDTQYGEITRIKKHNNNLFFWQDNAFGILSVNDRSLIQDSSSSSLVLGTGATLARYDYLTTSNGFNGATIGGILSTASGLYWFDKNRNEIVMFDKSVTPISKTKGIQSYLNTNKSSIGNKISFVHDKKYNEVMITI